MANRPEDLVEIVHAGLHGEPSTVRQHEHSLVQVDGRFYPGLLVYGLDNSRSGCAIAFQPTTVQIWKYEAFRVTTKELSVRNNDPAWLDKIFDFVAKFRRLPKRSVKAMLAAAREWTAYV